jgi:hypothetical protein
MSIYDERQVKGYNPQAGQQQVGKYPYVGPAYQKYGEQPGWVYSPRDDKYYRDQASREQLDEYEQQQGLKEKAPKQPGLLDTVAPMAGTLGAIYLGKTLGQEAIPFAKDALGLGSAASTSAAPATSSGLLGASGDVISTTSLPSVTATGGGASTAASSGVTAGGAVPPPSGLLGGIGSMTGSVSGLGALGGIAAATYLGGKSAMNMLQGKNDNSTQGKLGRGILGMATGGLSELARPLLGHKSTRERTSERTQGLLSASDDVDYQNYVQGMRKQYESAPLDPSKPFAGKYGSFDEYKAAGLEAADLTGVAGNIEAYGPEYAKLTQDQRQAITQANIDLDNYYSEGGDVLIKDKAKAEQARKQVLGDTSQVKGAAPIAPTSTPNAPQLQRSSTLSPGIGKDGKRIQNPGLLGAR